MLLGGAGLPAWARKKNEKYFELRDPAPNWQGRTVTGDRGRTGDRTGTQTKGKKKGLFSKNDG